ncbi:MAG: ACT domain-containing protein [Actinomycetes bacterium]
MGLRLTTLEGRFAVSRLPADAAVPRWAAGEVVAVTRTPDELSVICAEPAVPEATPAERGWRCLQVQGPLSFEMTGILAALSGPLADAHIPLLALSTYDTDTSWFGRSTWRRPTRPSSAPATGYDGPRRAVRGTTSPPL